MQQALEIQTQRLKLRPWKKADLRPFARLNADPQVMEFYPSLLNQEESHALAARYQAFIAKRGWGFWAVELRAEKKFIGFVGLNEPDYELPVTPCIEIGWRLAKEYWGYGYATEAAQGCLDFAFNTLGVAQVYSFTSIRNKKSEAVMLRLGMEKIMDDFEHPLLPENSLLRKHVLYRIEQHHWIKNRQ